MGPRAMFPPRPGETMRAVLDYLIILSTTLRRVSGLCTCSTTLRLVSGLCTCGTTLRLRDRVVPETPFKQNKNVG